MLHNKHSYTENNEEGAKNYCLDYNVNSRIDEFKQNEINYEKIDQISDFKHEYAKYFRINKNLTKI